MLTLISGTVLSVILVAVNVFSQVPNSTNYTLKNYELGNSGGGTSSSSNYNLNAEVGGQSGDAMNSTNYGVKPGEIQTQNSNVPLAPTLTNPSNEYNRLRLVINESGNPSDTTFAIAISSDNFSTTRFVKADNSVADTLLLSDYQTYTAWGGASGFWITGLDSNTTYKVKVKAMQGNFTESAYGPETAGVSTVQPSLSFGVAITPPSGPPFSITFPALTPGVVHDSNEDAELTLSTNSLAGGDVFIRDSNSGLFSSQAAYSIPSTTQDLSVTNSGYGAVVTSVSQSGGGPIASVSPFNGTGSSVGGLTSSLQKIVSTSAPVSDGTATVNFKAKTESTMPSAPDYTDVITFIAAMVY